MYTNRIYKFRGLTEGDDWVYGNLTILKCISDGYKPGCYISNRAGIPLAYRVRPETVGQYIGRKDEYNVEIYEGDNVRVHHADYRQYTIEYNVRSTEFLARREDGGWSGVGLSTVIIGNIHQEEEDI